MKLLNNPWRFLFIVWFIWWTVLFLIPMEYFNIMHSKTHSIPYLDKVVHISIFFMFSFLIYKNNRNAIKSAILSVIFTITYGITIEILQRIVGRGFDIYDYMADFIGVGLFYNCLFLYRVIQYLFKKKISN